MITKLANLTQRAKGKPKKKFNSLAHLLGEEFLIESYWELKRDKSPGVDEVTVEEYGIGLEERIKDLVCRMKAKRYKPQPAKRAYIPKDDGTRRGLGMPVVEDKIVQMGIKKILEAIYEEDFLDISYGFRPKRNCHDALSIVNEAIMAKPVNCIVDMDIKKFFDTINHEWMMKFLRQRITDKSLLRLIGKFLKAGIMEEGKYIETDKGTPQGGVVSPILANIYLHYILDLWFEKVVKKQQKGYTQFVRYADDFIVCYQNINEAKALGGKLKERLSKFGLEIAEGKSRIIEFGRNAWAIAKKKGKKRIDTFNFLGFTHYCAMGRNGKFKLGRKTIRTRYWQKIKKMNEWLKSVRNMVKLEEWWKTLRLKLLGHYRYYGIGGNMRSISMYYDEVVNLAYKWINRRSQKKSYTWEQFIRFLKYNSLPKPKIYHPYPIIMEKKYC